MPPKLTCEHDTDSEAAKAITDQFSDIKVEVLHNTDATKDNIASGIRPLGTSTRE